MKGRLSTFFLMFLLVGYASASPIKIGSVPLSPTLAPMSQVMPPMARDDADEDSVVYEYGFEDGWNDWTTRDVTRVGYTWHTTETHAYEGRSWWMGDEETNGYNDHWLQYLETPTLDLRGRQNLTLKFMAFWSSEFSADGDTAIPAPYNGWDGSNVWISTNNGQSWQVLTPTSPAYTRSSLYSFGLEWNMGANIPGWTNNSGDAEWPAAEWVPAEFNLDRFNQAAQVKIRWAFASDPGWHTGVTPGDPDNLAWGFMVDSLRVLSGNNVVWQNNGDARGDMALSAGPGQDEGRGNFWELTDSDAHTGTQSAHCPIHDKLINALMTPALEIPPVGYYTYFDFWVRADTKHNDVGGDNNLDDLFDVEVRSEGHGWQRVVYDYGRDAEWQENFHYFGPDTTFNVGLPEWKVKLNLTQWAGESIYLRWRMLTDSVTANVNVEGTGIYIDDFRLLTTARAQDDCGAEYVRVGFPNYIGFATPCKVGIRNFGLNDQVSVRTYFKVDQGVSTPIAPWPGLLSDERAARGFSLSANRVTYADSVTVLAYTWAAPDTISYNDTAYAPGVVVYPQGIWSLGYDNRDYTFRYNFDAGTGPLIKFTPIGDGIRGSFDIKALRVRWNAEQQGDSRCMLHVYRDNRGAVGQQLYETEVTVTRDNLLPNVHSISLAYAQELQRLQADFWVWFEILAADAPYPQIIGAEEKFGRGHYFTYNSQRADTMAAEWQVHAVLMTGGFSPTNTLTAGRSELNFDTCAVGEPKTLHVPLFNGGINPVTVQSARSGDANFRVEAFDETTLGIGDMMYINVTFLAETDAAVGTYLRITSSDETPPVVTLVANGGAASVGDDLPAPVEFSLGKAYPNPFNSTTVIPYAVPSAADVRVAVYDLSGRLVAELLNGRVAAGRHSVTYRADGLSTGVYLYRMEAGSFKSVEKLILVK